MWQAVRKKPHSPPKTTYIWMQENWMKDRGEIILQSDNGEHGGTVVHKQLRGSFRCHKKWIVYAGGQRDFPFNYGTNEMNTRRLYQIQRSVLHTGTSLTVSKDCRIYPGARCLTVRESDLALFDRRQKMTSDLFLFLLIHRNSYEQFPMLGYKQKTF